MILTVGKLMFRIICEKMQVLDSIIARVFVDVVDNLFGEKLSAKVSCHHSAVIKQSAPVSAIDDPATELSVVKNPAVEIVRTLVGRESAATPVMAMHVAQWFAFDPTTLRPGFRSDFRLLSAAALAGAKRYLSLAHASDFTRKVEVTT